MKAKKDRYREIGIEKLRLPAVFEAKNITALMRHKLDASRNLDFVLIQVAEPVETGDVIFWFRFRRAGGRPAGPRHHAAAYFVVSQTKRRML